MHPSVYDWVGRVVEEFDLEERRVLEVGSLDVNGSVRPHFAPLGYLGVDLREGNRVDRVVDIEEDKAVHQLFDECGQFDVVVCTEMLEHTPHPWLAVENMAFLLRREGHLLLTTRGFMFGRHDHPADYWRYSIESVRVLVEDVGLDPVEVIEDPDPQSPGVFAHAIKPKRLDAFPRRP